MPSDKSTVATKADFVPKAVGKTDRDRSVSSVLAHDERSQQPRPEVHGTQLNVLCMLGTSNPLYALVIRVQVKIAVPGILAL